MAYCDISDVTARNPARSIGTNTLPNASQVWGFINQCSGIIDAVLLQAGYAVPVATSTAGSSILQILQDANADGAWYKTEWAAPTSDKRSEAEDMWQSALKMLAKTELPLDKNAAQSRPRGGSIGTPAFFTRDMQL